MNTMERIRHVVPQRGQFVEYFGSRLFIPRGHFDEERMLAGGKPETHVLDILPRFLREGDVVLDVGANIGTHAFAMASIVKDGGCVYAVEADVDNVGSIRSSIAASGTTNIFLLGVAASDGPGLIRMLASSGTNSVFSTKADGSEVKVAVAVALDGVIEVHVAFIKLDIEGAELLALHGLDRTIARSRPVILSEFAPAYILSALGRDRSDEFFQFFATRAYDCFYLDPFGSVLHVDTFAALLAIHKEAFDRFTWNHIDVLFVPAEHPMPERPKRLVRPELPARISDVVPAAAAPLSAALPPPNLDEAALLDRMMPLVLERIRQERPWRSEIYVPSPEVAFVPETDPFMPYSTCSVRDFLHPRFAEINSLLEQPLLVHRKIWEHVYIIHHLEAAGVLARGARGLGFGVGKEMLPAIFADRGVEVVATDAPQEIGVGAGWASTNEYSPSIVDLPSGTMARADFLRHVSWRECDMNAIASDLSGFDFCWSSCCFEHLGSLDAGLDFVLESVEKTLKPGGIAVHTTELNLASNTDTIETGQTVLYRRRDIERLIATLRERGHEVGELVLAPDLLSLGGHVDTPPYGLPHLKLVLSGYVTTSVGIVVRRGR